MKNLRKLNNGAAAPLVLCLLITLFAGCQEKSETPVKGKQHILVDESLERLARAAADSFSALYPETALSLEVLRAREGIVKVLNREAELFVSSRDLNAEEMKFAADNKLEVRRLKLCYDAVILLARAGTFPPVLSYDSLRLLLRGGISGTTVFVPSANSGVGEYIRSEVLGGNQPTGTRVYETAGEQGVISAIGAAKNAAGFVSTGTAFDSAAFFPVMIGERQPAGSSSIYFEPHPGYLVQKLYPLTRMVTIVLAEVNNGVASGYATFLTGNIGQKMALALGYGPATVPVRIKR